MILPVKPVPETVNCCTLGLAEAVPTQADILPVAGEAVTVDSNTPVAVLVTERVFAIEFTGFVFAPLKIISRACDLLRGKQKKSDKISKYFPI